MSSQRILRSGDRQLRSSTGRRLGGAPSREPQLVAGRSGAAQSRSTAGKVVVELERRAAKRQRTEPQEWEAEAGSSGKFNRSVKPTASASVERKATGRTRASTSKPRVKSKEIALSDEDEAPKPKTQRAASSSSGVAKPKHNKSEEDAEDRSLKRKRDQYERDLLDLGKRELALAEKEEKLELSTAKLAKLKEAVMQREKEANDLVVSLGAGRAEEALAKLDESFTCALCFDIMACPYSLVPSKCGHTFCGLCLLKWFFAHLHHDCGSWHELMECPLCRAQLPFPSEPELPDQVPRPESSCPFTPNRLADKLLTDMVDILRHSVQPVASTSAASSSSTRKKRKSVATPASAAASWSEGGDSLTDWQARDGRGRREMAYITKDWCRLKPDHFRAIKDRLAL